MVKAIMKLKTLFVVLAAVFGMLFCANLDAQQINPDKVGTPAHSVKAFFRAMSNADFATAKKYVASKEHANMITLLEQLVKEMPEMMDEVKKEFSATANSMKFKSEKINGDVAEIKASAVNPETGKTEEIPLKLKKVNGIWKITE